jgi:hypothetical protein
VAATELTTAVSVPSPPALVREKQSRLSSSARPSRDKPAPRAHAASDLRAQTRHASLDTPRQCGTCGARLRRMPKARSTAGSSSRQLHGGGGSRTPVRNRFHGGVYVHSWWDYLWPPLRHHRQPVAGAATLFLAPPPGRGCPWHIATPWAFYSASPNRLRLGAASGPGNAYTVRYLSRSETEVAVVRSYCFGPVFRS